MSIEKIAVEQFLLLAKEHPVFDVRSPAEFLHAHIPYAYNLPLFNDEERKIIGTAYKQQSRKQAIKIGLDYFGIKMRKMAEEAELLIEERKSSNNKILYANNDHRPANIALVHCWRGGMRSSAVAWLLNLYGYKVYTLAGGYKALRNWVLQQFEKPYQFKVLGGYTGSGKTLLIEELHRTGHHIINLESLANHKGSAFGGLGQEKQPSQEMFENLLAVELNDKASANENDFNEDSIWLEDESRTIGKLNIPKNIWEKMRNCPVYFIDIPFEERLAYLVNTYGHFNKEDLVKAIVRIQKRLGGFETKIAIRYLLENNIAQSFAILLRYYDKYYDKGLNKRTNLHHLLNKIPSKTVSINNIDHLYHLQH